MEEMILEEPMEEREPVPALRFVLDVIVRPARAFTALAERGSRGWILIGLFVLIFSLTTIWVAAPIMQEKLVKSLQTVPQVQMEGVPRSKATPPAPPTPPPEVTQVVANPLFTVVIPSVSAFIGVILSWLLWAGVLHLLAVFLGGRSNFKTMFAAVVSASFPDGIRGLFQTIYILATHNIIQNPGLSGLVPLQPERSELNPMAMMQVPIGRILLHNFLARVDIFLVWRLFLLGLAVWATAQLSKRRAYLLVIGVWLLFTLLTLAPALISYTLFRNFAVMGG